MENRNSAIVLILPAPVHKQKKQCVSHDNCCDPRDVQIQEKKEKVLDRCFELFVLAYQFVHQ